MVTARLWKVKLSVSMQDLLYIIAYNSLLSAVTLHTWSHTAVLIVTDISWSYCELPGDFD